MQLQLPRHTLDLSRPRVMGILNVTPDSFSDGGAFLQRDTALYHAEAMIQSGADIIDVGGESTRPGAREISVQEELDRVVTVIEALHANFDIPLSIDTSKPEVMRSACLAGAAIINDVNALRSEGAIDVAARLGVAVCLMHMQGKPRTMQQNPNYDDVVADVSCFLLERAATCERAGIDRSAIVLDPGFGFGKTLNHNLYLLKHIEQLCMHPYPLLVGISRKSMIGSLLDDKPTGQRLHGSIAAAVIAAMKGASLLRVHDVSETVEAMKIVTAVLYADQG